MVWSKDGRNEEGLHVFGVHFTKYKCLLCVNLCVILIFIQFFLWFFLYMLYLYIDVVIHINLSNFISILEL